MNRELGFENLEKIMGWDDEDAQKESDWLRFMSKYKYDDYRGYLVGARFIESLVIWLQQFESKDQKAAYEYIKENLIYIGPAEIQRLIGKFFYEEVQKNLREKVAKTLGVPEYMVWSSERSVDEFKSEIRRTLFMGLSDGARLDSFRRANADISNEQVVITTEINNIKWEDLLKELADDSKDKGKDKEKQKFERVYLIDDFTASGTSLIREEKKELKGKLKKFADALKQAQENLTERLFVNRFQIIVHHYIGTYQAKEKIEQLYNEPWIKKELDIPDIRFSFGMLLPKDIRLIRSSEEKFADLCKKYYDHSIYDEHFRKSGAPDGKFGYAECGIPLILYHNTPNNSLSLLWAETKGDEGHTMKPLFKRGQRHKEWSG